MVVVDASGGSIVNHNSSTDHPRSHPTFGGMGGNTALLIILLYACISETEDLLTEGGVTI